MPAMPCHAQVLSLLPSSLTHARPKPPPARKETPFSSPTSINPLSIAEKTLTLPLRLKVLAVLVGKTNAVPVVPVGFKPVSTAVVNVEGVLIDLSFERL